MEQPQIQDPIDLHQITNSDYLDGSTTILQSDPWYEDGNVILQAEQMQFKVHKSILAGYSIVFKDMFVIGHVDSAAEDSSCPTIHMSDAAKDLQIILRIFYDH